MNILHILLISALFISPLQASEIQTEEQAKQKSALEAPRDGEQAGVSIASELQKSPGREELELKSAYYILFGKKGRGLPEVLRRKVFSYDKKWQRQLLIPQAADTTTHAQPHLGPNFIRKNLITVSYVQDEISREISTTNNILRIRNLLTDEYECKLVASSIITKIIDYVDPTDNTTKILFGCFDGVISILDTRTKKCEQKLKLGSFGSLLGIFEDPNDRNTKIVWGSFAAGTRKICIYDACAGSCQYTLDQIHVKGDLDRIISSYIDPTDRVLKMVSGSINGIISIRNMQTKKCEFKFKGHSDLIAELSCYIGADNVPRIMSKAYDGTIKIWKLGPTAFETAFGIKNDRNPQRELQ